ncbi:PDZ domain-containing protein [Flammeovirga yaeyamensis]|uniref:PDZ domain-containing protein n=1 Tax=Flammeovirga yaeyamensis TaxID=367791 RepID=A0AAX1N744_9BACT|nr:S41 family peptidase [Flammeovirga yaeyamensis]MBB3697975.1 carboxyl-terminal processing protease [Flammeovirga yaeyamensis]NMF35673.1 S41 family peptidase [Flammeovirga yaeyamensis]QWG03373.1 PDZ domain-containing protein [Flammeovirga yaeyamensis]
MTHDSTNSKNVDIKAWLPLIVGVSIGIGVLVGSHLRAPDPSTNRLMVDKNATKFERLLNYVDQYYVDSVDINVLTQEAIDHVLKDLDPHTVYVPADEADIMASRLDDGFEGVGIEFRVIEDTLKVLSVMPGGPSKKIGIRAGDKIIVVNGDTIAGKELDNASIVKKLRGKKGTKVDIEIKRKKKEELIAFTITRDVVPTPSVEAHYMIDEETGYIKISKFATKTYDEFHNALLFLKSEGMENLVIDLRNNGGGFLGQAVKIADDLLPKDDLIVYTEGKGNEFTEKEFSKRNPDFEGPIAILVNERSASASEIVTGALQDHDRAVVIGRRTYGKGLVQRQIRLKDNSLLRLTISRYFTPSGRSIQKPYGEGISYGDDISNRYESGELFNKDSIKTDKMPQFKTDKNRIVYGGGGIIPDNFIPLDTASMGIYYYTLEHTDVLRDFAIEYANDRYIDLMENGLDHFIKDFDKQKNVIQDLEDFAVLMGINKRKPNINDTTININLKHRIKELIAQTIWGDEGYYKVANLKDPMVNEAQKVFDEGLAEDDTTSKSKS